MRARAIILSLSLALPALAFAGQVAGCVFTSADDCVLTLGFGCKSAGSATTGSTGTGGNGGTAGSGGIGGTSSTTSGTGGTPECTGSDATPCAEVPDGLCKSFGTKTCTKGKCGVKYATGDAPSQKYGSCKKTFCGSNGLPTDIEDDNNVYDDGNPCTKETCSNGLPGKTPLTTGTPCTAMGVPGYCEQDPYSGVIACLQCDPPTSAMTCGGLPGTTCVGGTCVPNHCTDGSKDLGETDLDCGGGACLKCAPNMSCSTYKDCSSQVCTAGKCAAPTCLDTHQNQDETDVDCGGATGCPACGDGLACAKASDCLSHVCMSPGAGLPNACQAPTCTDGVQNGDEAGIDCGGATSMCPPCAM
jgi:hypothetical protein